VELVYKGFDKKLVWEKNCEKQKDLYIISDMIAIGDI